MNTPISPTRLIVKALNMPLGHPTAKRQKQAKQRVATQHDICVACGGPINIGEPVCPTAVELDEGFNNKHDVAYQNGSLICGACAAVWDGDWRTRWSKSVATERGVYSLAKNAHQAHFILNPPPRPFVAFVSDGKMQHLTWRSAVTYGDDLIFLRLGDRQLSWSRMRVLDAFEAVKTLQTLMEHSNLKGLHPFQRLDRELACSIGSSIRSDVIRAAAEDGPSLAAIRLIESLTLGEFWAVSILVMTPPESIEAPQPISN